MIVVTRHAVDEGGEAAFLGQARAALTALAARPGYRAGRIGRAVEDPTCWVLITEWDGVGTYRRALSAYDVRVTAVPLLSTAIEEPTAFELVVDRDDAHPAGDPPVGMRP